MDGSDVAPHVHGAARPSPVLLFGASMLVIAILLGLAAVDRGSTIDEDDLAEDMAQRLESDERDLEGLECEDDLDKEVGATIECHGTEDGQRRTAKVRVTSVDGDRVTYTIALS